MADAKNGRVIQESSMKKKKVIDWSVPPAVFKKWKKRFTITKGDVPSFKVTWCYYVVAILVAIGIGVGLSLGSIYLLG